MIPRLLWYSKDLVRGNKAGSAMHTLSSLSSSHVLGAGRRKLYDSVPNAPSSSCAIYGDQDTKTCRSSRLSQLGS